MGEQQNIISKLFGAKGNTESKSASTPSWYGAMQSYMQTPASAVWSGRSYTKFADEAYSRNVVAHRAVSMIASGAASINLNVQASDDINEQLVTLLKKLINSPNPSESRACFFKKAYSYLLISGNAYLHGVSAEGELVNELHLLRPDRVSVVAGRGGIPAGYRYKSGDTVQNFAVDRLTGASRILHIKEFHPTDDWYGLSPVEAAAYSIDQHNQAAAWNQSLLQNGARPSGALVVKTTDSSNGHLSEEQYWRIKNQIDAEFSGSNNAGRPLLLEGGLEWKEMSLSPKDMDFIDCKNSAARDIALAFGVPPQLLGISGDNSYSNLAEARLALWEQTIVPLVGQLVDSLNSWLLPIFGLDNQEVKISYDLNSISALAPKREKLWKRINDADFLSDEEKREMLGL